jgi:DNA-binding transcriptional regulator YbjK
MRYHQLSEVFGHLVTLNMATLAFYERSLKVTKQERARMFLHYLTAKQKVRNEHLMASLADGPTKMFEMWFDDEIDLQLLVFIERLALEPSAKSDKILIVLMEVNEKIEMWLKSVSSAIINSDAREYIQDLINYLSQTNQQIIHGFRRMDDV